MTSLQVALDAGERRLDAAGIPTPRVDAELLLGHVLGLARGRLAARAAVGDVLEAADLDAYEQLLTRREQREPLQHITGFAQFRHLELRVGPGVFVPRPETEVLAQIAIDALLAVPKARPRAVDLGTGSGAIALSLATEVAHSAVTAIERSPAAIAWARRNAQDARVENPDLVLGDLRDALPEPARPVDVVVSNPPYIPDDAIPRDPEVRLHDPALALYGGADGLDVVRALSATAMRLLVPGGVLAIEHGEAQGAAVQSLLKADGWRGLATHPDLSGRPRVTTASRPVDAPGHRPAAWENGPDGGHL